MILNKFRKHCDKQINKIIDKIIFDKVIEPENIDIIFNLKKDNTMWSNYNIWNKDTIKNEINSVVDLAGNSGFLSTLIKKITNIKNVSSIDYDEIAIEYGLNILKNYKNNIN